MLGSDDYFCFFSEAVLNNSFGVDVELLEERTSGEEFDVVVVGNFES